MIYKVILTKLYSEHSLQHFQHPRRNPGLPPAGIGDFLAAYQTLNRTAGIAEDDLLVLAFRAAHFDEFAAGLSGFHVVVSGISGCCI